MAHELIACKIMNLYSTLPYISSVLTLYMKNLHSCALYNYEYVAFVAFVFIQRDIGSLRVKIAIIMYIQLKYLTVYTLTTQQ